MNSQLSNNAKDVLSNAGIELIRLYTGSALELNAYDVTARGYIQRSDNFLLSTTVNIPEELKLPLEIDHEKSREELIEHYKTEAIKRTCEDYVVRSISVTDAFLEEVYEISIELLNSDFTEEQRQRKVRSAWARDSNRTKIATYLIDVAGLRAPPGKISTVDMVFDRYCEIREVRHALVHNKGSLSTKNLDRLNQLRDKLPPDLRHGSIASASFLEDGIVNLNLHEMLFLRRWFYETILGFLRESFDYSSRTNETKT